MTVLTPELASKMLDVYEHRCRMHHHGIRYQNSILSEALERPHYKAPPPMRAGAGSYLKRPAWKHDKGSRS